MAVGAVVAVGSSVAVAAVVAVGASVAVGAVVGVDAVVAVGAVVGPLTALPRALSPTEWWASLYPNPSVDVGTCPFARSIATTSAASATRSIPRPKVLIPGGPPELFPM